MGANGKRAKNISLNLGQRLGNVGAEAYPTRPWVPMEKRPKYFFSSLNSGQTLRTRTDIVTIIVASSALVS